jgi:hypothetical protein
MQSKQTSPCIGGDGEEEWSEGHWPTCSCDVLAEEMSDQRNIELAF